MKTNTVNRPFIYERTFKTQYFVISKVKIFSANANQ